MATQLDTSTGQQPFAEQAAQQETPKHYHSTEIRVCELEDSETTRCIIFAATLIKPGDGQLVVRSTLHFPAPKNLRMDTFRGQGTRNNFEF